MFFVIIGFIMLVVGIYISLVSTYSIHKEPIMNSKIKQTYKNIVTFSTFMIVFAIIIISIGISGI